MNKILFLFTFLFLARVYAAGIVSEQITCKFNQDFISVQKGMSGNIVLEAKAFQDNGYQIRNEVGAIFTAGGVFPGEDTQYLFLKVNKSSIQISEPNIGQHYQLEGFGGPYNSWIFQCYIHQSVQDAKKFIDQN